MSNNPVRLNKVEPEPVGKIEAFILNHATFFLLTAMIVLMILIMFLMYMMSGLSATDSGLQYNHLQDVI